MVDRVDSVEVQTAVKDNVDQTIVKNYDIYAVDVNRKKKEAGVSFSRYSTSYKSSK